MTVPRRVTWKLSFSRARCRQDRGFIRDRGGAGGGMGWWWWRPQFTGGELRRAFASAVLGVSVFSMRLVPESTWSGSSVVGSSEIQAQFSPPSLQDNDPEDMFGEANVLACILDMVMAGTETTAATLQWAVFLMVKYPHVQGESQPPPRQRTL